MLSKGERLLVAVRRGALLRLRGPRYRAGFAWRTASGGFSILWRERSNGPLELRVPTFGRQRWLVLQAARQGRFHLGVADAEERYLEWGEFLDALVRRAARPDRESSLPRAPDATARRVSNRLNALIRGLRATGVEDPEGRRVSGSSLKRWLALEARLLRGELHPMRPPWFVRAAEREGVVMREGRTLNLRAARADVWSLRVRARPAAPAELAIYAGTTLVSVEKWSGAERAGSDGWTASKRIVRVVTRDTAAPVRVRVIQGEVSLDAVGYRRRPSLWRELQSESASSAQSPDDFVDTTLKLHLGTPGDRHQAERLVADEKQPAFVRAFVAGALSRSARTAVEAGQWAGHAMDGLSPALTLPVLVHLLRVGATLPPQSCEARSQATTDDLDFVLSEAIRHVLCPSAKESAPKATEALERVARKHPDDRLIAAAARVVVRREVAWRVVEPKKAEYHSAIAQPRDGRADRRCRPMGDGGLRWILLGPGRHRFHLTGEDVQVRVLRVEDGWEGSIKIDQEQVPVHGAAALTSRVRVRRGHRVIQVPRNAPPLLFRIPQASLQPCASLRDVRRWPMLGSRLEYRLPTAGTQLRTARLYLHTLRRGTLPRRVEIIAGQRSLYLEVPTGARNVRVELPVAPGTRMLTLLPDTSAAGVIAALRLPFARGAPPAPSQMGGGTRDDESGAPRAAETEEERAAALRDIRESSVALRAEARAGVRKQLHVRRGRALVSLGQRRLARIDENAARVVIPSPRPEAVVQPRSLPARIQPLPGGDRRRLRLARRLAARGAREQALEVLSPPRPGTPEALLAAILLERGDQRQEAAKVWEETRDPEALAHAARLVADEGVEQDSPEATVTALIMASAAEMSGVRALGIRSRVSSRVGWESFPYVEQAAGARWVTRARTGEDASLGVRVRHAWSAAPPGALVVREEEGLDASVRLPATVELLVSGRCIALEPGEPCQMGISIDDREPIPLTRAPTPLPLGAGRHRFQARSDRPGIGWVLLRDPNTLDPVGTEVSSRYYRATPDQAVRLVVLGPTVVRLDVAEEEPAPREAGRPAIVHLDDRPVRSVTASETNTRLYLPVVRSGAHEVRVDAPEGAVLVRPRYAVHDAAPRPAVPERVRGPEQPSWSAPLVQYGAASRPVEEPLSPGPLTAYGAVRGVAAEIGDLDVLAEGAPYLEIAGGVRRRLSSAEDHFHVGAMSRARLGAPSFGAEAQLQLAGQGWRPRLLLSSQLFMQGVSASEVAWSARGRVSTIWTAPLTPIMSLHPLATLDVVHIQPVSRDAENVDARVFNRFDRDHPRTIRAGVVWFTRPFVELFTRAGVYVRTNDIELTIDRFEARGSVDLVRPGPIFPLLGLTYEYSYRLADAFRPLPIGRHTVTARTWSWGQWFDQSHVSLGGEFQFIADRKEFAGFLTMRYLWSPYRGLVDFPNREAPYSELLEREATTSPLLRARRPDAVIVAE